ncbi:hypothetical protein BH09ACT13_BH09ACT13_10090 [soil metagenome]
MRRVTLAAAGAAIAALVVSPLGGSQGSAPTLREAPGSAFPDRAYTLQIPERRALGADQLSLTENGGAVTGLAVEAPGTDTGVILLVDASNSMRGAPIAGAMAAARAFMAQRAGALPVAVIAYNPEITVLSEFTTDKGELAAAVASAPALSEGTHIYDALIKAAELAEEEGLPRATAVLLSDGHRRGVQATQAEALEALTNANVRVSSVGLRSAQCDPQTLRGVARQTGGTYVESATPADLEPIFRGISAQLSNEYLVTYRSLLPPNISATVIASVAGFPPATAEYTTPAIDLAPRGTFDRTYVDKTILSPWLMIFVVLSVLVLLVFAVLTAVDVRSRSMRRRMAQYVNSPTEEESRLRRAEVTSLLAEQAQRRVGGHRSWQAFERNVELAGFRASALTIAGWAMVGAIAVSILAALVLQSLGGLLVGLLVPVIARFFVSIRVSRVRNAFGEQLPDNLEVIAGALRAGHSLVGAMNVMVDGAAEPSKTEFRRVLQDEQLGVPLDEALQIMARRMESNDIEQVALVTRLAREAGGNTAEVLDRVVENIRGRQELQRLVAVLTAQGRLARWILTALPLCLVGFLLVVNPDWLDPLFETNAGRASLVLWVFLLVTGTYILNKITKIVV